MAPTREDEAALKAYGRSVRSRREQLELSQEELGFRAELDRTYVSGIERGIRNPTLLTMRRLAKALESKPSELLADAGA